MCFSQPELAPLAKEAAHDCPSLRSVFTALPALETNPPALPQVDADSPAILLYTSGTTARPKGVTHTHRSLLHTAKLMRGVAPDSMQTVLVMTQMMHTSGINCDLLPAISLGGTAVLVAAFDAA